MTKVILYQVPWVEPVGVDRHGGIIVFIPPNLELYTSHFRLSSFTPWTVLHASDHDVALNVNFLQYTILRQHIMPQPNFWLCPPCIFPLSILYSL